MDNFANIGKAAIIQSLGIQKNYTEVIETTVDAIDYSNTACSTCKYKAIINTFDENSKPYADACASCASCPHKTLIQKNVYKKIYHNEKTVMVTDLCLRLMPLNCFCYCIFIT